jgi:uncharacterized protein YkwD
MLRPLSAIMMHAGSGEYRMRHFRLAGRGLFGALILVLLAACSAGPDTSAEPSFYRSMASADAPLDAKTAASMISGFRMNNGLGPVDIDPELMQIAQAQASAMAARDKLDHNVIRDLGNRLKGSGYNGRVAAENVGAGYHTLAEAFSGWRDSPPHRKNMLLAGATHIGIATAYAPNSKYKVYWALILAGPDA